MEKSTFWDIEGVLWFEKARPEDFSKVYKFNNGILEYYVYVPSADLADMLKIVMGVDVKKGYLLKQSLSDSYAILRNGDGTSGTMTFPNRTVEFKELSGGTVILASDIHHEEVLVTPEKLGIAITGILELDIDF